MVLNLLKAHPLDQMQAILAKSFAQFQLNQRAEVLERKLDEIHAATRALWPPRVHGLDLPVADCSTMPAGNGRTGLRPGDRNRLKWRRGFISSQPAAWPDSQKAAGSC